MSCDISLHYLMRAFLIEQPIDAPLKDDTRSSNLIPDAQDDDVLVIPLDGPIEEMRVTPPRFNKATKRLFTDCSEGESAWETFGMNSIQLLV